MTEFLRFSGTHDPKLTPKTNLKDQRLFSGISLNTYPTSVARKLSMLLRAHFRRALLPRVVYAPEKIRLYTDNIFSFTS
jgi:hypothetical protein